MAVRRRLVVAALLTLIAALVALGVWQLQRRAWKLALIAQVEKRLAAPPVEAPGPDRWAAIGTNDTYKRVSVRGTWRPVQPVLTQAATELGGGYWVMAPLDTAQGSTVLINRGFVPLDDKRNLMPPAGATTIVGLLRVTEPKGGFLRDNRPEDDRWYSRDVAAIAQARHLGRVAPYFIDADAVPGQPRPRGGLTVVRFANNHFVYALTWFAMAALLAFATWRVAGFRRGD